MLHLTEEIFDDLLDCLDRASELFKCVSCKSDIVELEELALHGNLLPIITGNADTRAS